MMRVRAMIALMGCGCLAMATASAQERPIKQLPADLARWSMSWTEVPKDMVMVGQEYGPVAAVTWGPVQGGASLVNNTATELWNLMRSQKQNRPSARASTGMALVRYEF